MSKVINIFEAKKEKKDKEIQKPKEEESDQVDFQGLFEEAIKKNEENKKRLKEERLKANKSVLRSYRIKD